MNLNFCCEPFLSQNHVFFVREIFFIVLKYGTAGFGNAASRSSSTGKGAAHIRKFNSGTWFVREPLVCAAYVCNLHADNYERLQYRRVAFSSES